MKRKSGFTLIELIIVITIIGILAAIAVPRLSQYKLEAQTAKELASANSIYKAVLAYDTANNIYITDGSMPMYHNFADGSCVLAPYVDDSVKFESIYAFVDEPGEFSVAAWLSPEYNSQNNPIYRHYIYYYDPRVAAITDNPMMDMTALVNGVPVMAFRNKFDPETGKISYTTVEEFLEEHSNK